MEFIDALINNGYNKPSFYQYKNFIKQAFPKGGINTKTQLAIFLGMKIFFFQNFIFFRNYAIFQS